VIVMGNAADRAQPPLPTERTTGELVKELSEQISALVRDELKLAQLEMASKGKRARTSIGLFGGSGLAAWYGVGCLIACAVAAMSLVLDVWVAALIAGAVLLVVAGILAQAGKRGMRKATPLAPRQSAASLQADLEMIKERVQR
jgi:hypothetical protein